VEFEQITIVLQYTLFSTKCCQIVATTALQHCFTSHSGIWTNHCFRQFVIENTDCFPIKNYPFVFVSILLFVLKLISIFNRLGNRIPSLNKGRNGPMKSIKSSSRLWNCMVVAGVKLKVKFIY